MNFVQRKIRQSINHRINNYRERRNYNFLCGSRYLKNTFSKKIHPAQNFSKKSDVNDFLILFIFFSSFFVLWRNLPSTATKKEEEERNLLFYKINHSNAN